MKTCPKCKELNGENSTVCFKCKTSFPGSGRVDNYKKKCRKCGAIYNSGAVICDQCGGGLSAYDPSYSSNSSGNSNAEGSKGAKAVLAVGHTIGFVGRLLWTLVNWALGLLLIVGVFKGWLPQWWWYILCPVLAVFCIVNGFRCITGRSYWGY